MPKPLTLKNHSQEYRLFLMRSYLLALGMIILAILLFARLFFLQVILQHRYKTLSTQNHMTVVPLPPNRGLITDRHGVLLAENVPVFNLEIVPERVKHMRATLDELRKLISISDEDILSFQRLRRQHHRYDPIPLRVKLSPEEVAIIAVNQFRLPGVAVNARLMRHYPLGQPFAHVLGFVGRINTKELHHVESANYAATHYIGKVGIEKYYESSLHGSTGYEQAEIDASGKIIRVVKRVPPVPGQTLELTIDSKLQQAADKALGDHRGAVVALDPHNGEVLAMVSKPSYDPNLFVMGISQKAFNELAESRERPLYNRAIRGQYPPASTIKPLLALHALDEAIVTPDERIYDPGWFKLPHTKHMYHDWKRSGHGWIGILKAITVSCDTYFYHLGQLLGIKRIDDIFERYGLGQATGIDMGEEVPGLVPTPEWKRQSRNSNWFTGDTLISAIGQGYVLSTPVQLAEASGAIALRGLRYQPHLLKTRHLPNQDSIDTPIIELPSVVLQHGWVWDLVIEAMHDVVRRRHGTGRRFGRDAPYTVAVKTGTAQVFSLLKHRYKNNEEIPEFLRDHSVFIAFAPVNKPKIALAIVIENSPDAPRVARKVLDHFFKTTLEKKHDLAPTRS